MAIFKDNKRIHIGLRSVRFEESLDFYRKFFGQEPTKLREGYAKFELEEPPLNFTLNASSKSKDHQRLSHLGIQVKSSAEVGEQEILLEKRGLKTRLEKGASCCYAVQDKVWVKDPDGNPWETFVVLREDEDKTITQSCCG